MPHAFVGVGWDSVTKSEVRPLWISVANGRDAATGEDLTEFRVKALALPPSVRWSMCPAIGVPLSMKDRDHARALVRPALKRRPFGVAAARLLAEALLAVARRDPAVGDEPTCVVLPRPKPAKEASIVFPPVHVAPHFSGAVAFDLVGRPAAFRWNPPISVSPGAMIIPEVTFGPDGEVSSKASVHLAPSAMPEGARFGVGLTNGGKEVSLSIDKDGKPVVEERDKRDPSG
jgi:hypothetical protein